MSASQKIPNIFTAPNIDKDKESTSRDVQITTIYASFYIKFFTHYPVELKEMESLSYHKIHEMMTYWTAKFPELQTISATEITRLRQEGHKIILIDVRGEAERNVSVIASSISVKEFEEMVKTSSSLAELQDPSTIIVPYCAVGYRSGRFARTLISNGFQSVRNSEGIILWTYTADKEGSLVDMKTGEATRKVHVLGPPWALASPDYEMVSMSYLGVATYMLGYYIS